jgi:3'-phosphoadenosine 5'-phosphosulfate sulfotransferase (PAPS reductase)/FAD synthetase
MEKKLSIGEVRQKQSLPLEAKVKMTERRIREWYDYWGGDVYVSFSGGKDSTVLLHIARQIYPNITAVYFNTPDFPEVKSFIKSCGNITWINPKKSFVEILRDYGYPVISKEQSQFIEEYRNTKSEKLKALRMEGIIAGGMESKIGKISEKWKYMVDAPFKISDKCCDVMKKILLILLIKNMVCIH